MCAGQARLFLHGEDELEIRVSEARVLHDGEHGGNPDAVVRTQRGARGPYPVSIPYQADGVAAEVVGRALVLFTYHVQVRLEGQGGHPLVPGFFTMTLPASSVVHASPRPLARVLTCPAMAASLPDSLGIREISPKCLHKA